MAVEISETNHQFEKVEGEYLANGFLMFSFYDREYMKKIPDFPLDPNDTLLSTYPRSGTTFTQRIISGLKYGPSAIANKDFDLFQEFPHLDLNCFHENLTYCGYETALKKEVPRMVKTHVPLSIAPKSVHTNNSKVIFVLRNPRDVLVSLYHFNKKDTTIKFNFDFDTFFDMFLEGCVMNGDWCRYNAEWLQFCHQHPSRTLILTYEQLLFDFDSQASKLATFLDLPDVTSDVIQGVKEQTNVNKMRETTLCGGQEDFVRKGISGDWKNHFSKDQCEKFDQWIVDQKKKYPKELFDLVGE